MTSILLLVLGTFVATGDTSNTSQLYSSNTSYPDLSITSHLDLVVSNNDTRIANLEGYLAYVLPFLCSIILPFSALNIYLLVMQEAWYRPSHLIYVNLLISDILTTIGGIALVIYFKHHSKHALWWFNNMIWLSFYCGVPLLFGLVLIRILVTQLRASTWLSYSIKIARAITLCSWLIGLIVPVLHDTVHFGTIGNVIKDVAIIAVVLPTMVMNLYIWCVFRRAIESDAHTTSYRRASLTALLLFLNFFLCYTYFTSCYVFYIYTVASGNPNCSSASWPGLLFCTDQGRHYVGECSMLLQSLGNNIILITQPESKEILRLVVRYYKGYVVEALWGVEGSSLIGRPTTDTNGRL